MKNKILIGISVLVLSLNHLNAVPVTGTVKTWASGEVLSSSDLNTTIASLKNAILGITSSQWTTNGSDIYYSTGNIGIGTSSPSTPLHISSSNGIFRYTSGNGSTPSLQLNSTSGKTGSVNVGTSGMSLIYDSTGYLVIQKDTKSTIYNTGFGASSNTPVAFFESTGNIGIGTWTPAYTLHVIGSVAGTSAYNNLSDIRFKTNVLPIMNPLEKLLNLRGVSYYWKHNDYKELNLKKDRDIGFIGQDVEKIAPEVVTKDSKGVLSMSYTGLIPIIVEGFKEFASSTNALISNQSNNLENLKKENIFLREKFKTLEDRESLNEKKLNQLSEKIQKLENRK